MPLSQHIHQALNNIFSSKLRSFLALLGILVGTASVVALVSSGELATKKALDQFKTLGTDLMAINMFETGGGNPSGEGEEFDVQYSRRMTKYVDEIRLLAPYTTIYLPTNYGGHNLNASIIGVTESLKDTIKISMKRGRFISFLDKYSYFCVIGPKIYEQILETTKEDPIGKQIQLGKFYFTVVGVTDAWPENSFFNADINKSIMVPIQTSKVINKYAKVHNIVMKLLEEANLKKVQADITNFMAQYFPDMKLFFRSASQLIQSMKNQQDTLTLMLGFIGGISLFVGGIGVMNVMLVSVAERKREIGIRMAVGARRKDIRTLFLIEAIVLALIGGIFGILTGIIASYVIAKFSGWEFTVFLEPPLLGFVVSVATGVFFGFYPAYRASKLDPIQTLRYD